MSERLKEVMTQTLGEDGVSFIDQGYFPEVSLMERVGSVQDIIGDCLYAMRLAGIDFTAQKSPKPNGRYQNGGVTSNIIVPGYASRNSNFSSLRRDLAQHGIDSHAIRIYDTPRLINPFDAIESAEFVTRAVEESPAERVNLICHSFGGIIAAVGCQNLKPEDRERIGRIITLGTPWRGAPLAKIFGLLKINDKALKDLSPGSDIVTKELPKVDDQIRAKTVSLGSANDIIVPWESSILEGSSLNAILRRNRAVTHANFLHDRYVAQAVARILMN